MKSTYAKLQGGERFDDLSEERIADILERLHPEYDARATFYLRDDAWLSAFGCVSDGFGMSHQSSSAAPIMYCSQTLSLPEARTLIARFIRGEPEWRGTLRWRVESRALRVGIALVVVAVTVSILILFARDIAAWF